MSGPTAIRFDDVTVVRDERTVLSRMSFAIEAGRVTAVIGPNGSGKSTLIMAAGGLIPIAAGGVWFGSRELAAMSLTVRAGAIAYVPQRSDLVAPVAVRDVVAMGCYARAGSAAIRGRAALDQERDAIAAALAQVDAGPLVDRPFTSLSGGEAQRVLLARALVSGAEVLLLDEPTSALDIAHRLHFHALLRDLAALGKTVVVAMHELNDVADLADALLVLHQGTVRAMGACQAVLTPELVRGVYGVDMVAGGFRYRAVGRGAGT